MVITHHQDGRALESDVEAFCCQSESVLRLQTGSSVFEGLRYEVHLLACVLTTRYTYGTSVSASSPSYSQCKELYEDYTMIFVRRSVHFIDHFHLI